MWQIEMCSMLKKGLYELMGLFVCAPIITTIMLQFSIEIFTIGPFELFFINSYFFCFCKHFINHKHIFVSIFYYF